ncbi:MAG: Rdx family protein [Gemmataceae bacterium]|nr:Rdx family protein [Gemmataceae bacterium]
MTGRILEVLKQKVQEYKLIPARGGCFELTVDGELIYSKLATGSFPDERAMLDAVRARLPANR